MLKGNLPFSIFADLTLLGIRSPKPAMLSTTNASPSDIAQLVRTILARRRIGRHEQQKLMSLLWRADLGTSEREAIDLLYAALKRGRLQVVD